MKTLLIVMTTVAVVWSLLVLAFNALRAGTTDFVGGWTIGLVWAVVGAVDVALYFG